MFKKGEYNWGRKTIYIMIAIFVILFVFLYMRHAITSYNDTTIRDSSKIEGAIIVAEALISPKCFAYYDKEIDRVYPGIIDAFKFNDKNLGKGCMPYIDSPYKIQLGKAVLGNDEEPLEMIRAPVLLSGIGDLKPTYLEISVADYYAQRMQKGPRTGPYYQTA